MLFLSLRLLSQYSGVPTHNQLTSWSSSALCPEGRVPANRDACQPILLDNVAFALHTRVYPVYLIAWLRYEHLIADLEHLSKS